MFDYILVVDYILNGIRDKMFDYILVIDYM